MFLRYGLIGLVLAGSATLARAEAEEFILDPIHSSVEFEVPHIKIFTVKGRFDKFDGVVKLDTKDLAKSDVDAWVDVASISTGGDDMTKKRDDHLKSADFFDAKKFPKMTLKKKSITDVKGEKFKLIADLTMHGVTKEVPFDVDYMGSITAMGKKQAMFKATGKVNRQDFGMKFNKLDGTIPLVGDEVTITISAHTILKKDAEKK